MNASLLIHAIVRQTTVLIATLATTSGQRAQLAAVANVVFADLVRELREQGLGNKVIADMFGLALRTYHRKLARLTASRTVQGRSLWEAVLAHIQQQGPLLRSELLHRFARDDEATLHSVLADLVSSGLVEREGSDDAQRVQASRARSDSDPATGPAALDAMILVAIHRSGPLTAAAVAEIVPAAAPEIEAALARLSTEKVITQSGDPASYDCESCVLQFGEAVGWEAAVFDHYQALVSAIVTKLQTGKRRADLADSIGGSTFVFDLWQGHPAEAEVLGFLRTVREQGMALRRKVEQHNTAAGVPPDAKARRVTAYVGQSVAEDGNDDA